MMAHQAGQAYQVRAVGDGVALVHAKTGRVIFNLASIAVQIDMSGGAVSTVTGTFIILEPDEADPLKAGKND
jgi:hypothetical protein